MAYPVKVRGIEDAARDVLLEQLKGIPFLQAGKAVEKPRTGDAGIDFSVAVKTRNGRFRIVCEVKSSGQPRIARQACLQLLEYTRSNPRDYPVFVAPFISAQAAEICKGFNTGYMDLAGNCRLAFDQVYIQKGQYPNPAVVKRELRSLYSPKAERVLRVLLTNPRKAWKTEPLAREADVSLGQVANIKKVLLNREWIRFETEGFGLNNPTELLNEWGSNYDFSRNEVRDYYSLMGIGEIESELTNASRKIEFILGFTEFSGAARLSPAVRYQRVSAYVLGDVGSLAKSAELKSVPSGANVSLIVPYDNGVFYGATRIDGAPVLSPVQVYLDLLGMKSRGEEAAQAILKEVIIPAWR